MIKSLLALLISFGISAVSMPLLRRMALSGEMLDNPAADRWHSQSVPLLGGVGLFLSVNIPLAILEGFDLRFVAMIGGGLLAFLGGLYDDIRKDLGALGKVALMLLISVFPLTLGFHIDFISPLWLGYLVGLIWLFGIINGVNMLDNADGLSSGIAAICGVMIFLYAEINNLGLGGFGASAGLTIAGASLGYLVYNFPPATIFMGDSGALFLGYSLALIPLMAHWRPTNRTPLFWLAPVMILVMPIFETTLMVIERSRHKKAFFRGDKGHSSHRLIEIGFSEQSMLIIPYLICLSAGGLGLALPKISFLWQLILSISGFSLVLFLIYLLSQIPVYHNFIPGHFNNKSGVILWRLKATIAAIIMVPAVAWFIILT